MHRRTRRSKSKRHYSAHRGLAFVQECLQ